MNLFFEFGMRELGATFSVNVPKAGALKTEIALFVFISSFLYAIAIGFIEN